MPLKRDGVLRKRVSFIFFHVSIIMIANTLNLHIYTSSLNLTFLLISNHKFYQIFIYLIVLVINRIKYIIKGKYYMPSFKPKPSKKIVINKKDVVTLDEKHREFMNNFSFDENVTIPKLRKYRKHLRKKLDLLTIKLNVKPSDITWTTNQKIEDSLDDETEEIFRLC